MRLFQSFNKSDGRIIRILCRIERNRPGPFNTGDRIRRLHDLPRLRWPGASWRVCGDRSLRTSIGVGSMAVTSGETYRQSARATDGVLQAEETRLKNTAPASRVGLTRWGAWLRCPALMFDGHARRAPGSTAPCASLPNEPFLSNENT